MSRTRKLLMLPLLLFVLACRPSCDDSPPTLHCDTVSLNVDPGQCVEFSNPCDDHAWERLDGFRICGRDMESPPAGLFLETRQNPRSRSLCAVASMSPLTDVPVDYFYVRGFHFGVGTFRVTVGEGMSVSVTSSPSTIAPGGTSQLETQVTGGTPPYAFIWTPAAFVSNPSIQNPIASPVSTTTYTVTVFDSIGLTGDASVVVNVGLGVTVAADPATIDPGESTSLSAVPLGGTGPYTFAWTPAASVDDPASPTPLAMPTETTTYSVLVTDANGAVAEGVVTVDVNLRVNATATPASVDPGQSSQLEAVAEGGSPPYAFAWTPVGSLDDETLADPVATPIASTTYTVTVTDSTGEQVAATVDVEVVPPAGGLNACIASIVQTGMFTAEADGSCSSGDIVEYRWWADFNFEGQLPTGVTTTPSSPVFVYDEAGIYDVRLEVVTANGDSDAIVVPFEVN